MNRIRRILDSDKVRFPRRSEPVDDPFADEFAEAAPISPKAKPKPKLPTANTEAFLKRNISALPEFATESKFEWKDLNVFVGSDDDQFQILHNSSGCIESGQLLAVMGGSGAGKSTLLNALSGRTNLNEQTVHGEMAINGKTFACSKQNIIKSMCTYVPQSDILCPTQTVEEALMFYAQLKLPHLTADKQRKRVDYLIHVLHLDKCRHNHIGSEAKRGISGGEKRRVSIASEILNDANIIFLDEPTSGLDAYTAARTIKTLKQFCFVSNKIIIATIHQPSIEVFYLFDLLLLLSNGRCCYNAPIRQLDDFFATSLQPKTNPADVIIFEAQRNPGPCADEWDNAEINVFRNDNADKVAQWDEYLAFDEQLKKKKRSLWLEYKLLLVRELKGMIRDKRVTLIRLAQILFFGIVCGTLFFDLASFIDGDNPASYVTKTSTCHFLMCTIALLFGMVSLLTVFPKQKLLFQREYSSKAYSVTTWAVCHILLELPRQAIFIILFSVIAIPMTGMDGDLMAYFFTLFLSTIAGGSFGYFFGTITKTTVEAVQTVPLAFIPLLIFSDTFLRITDLGLPEDLGDACTAVDPLYWTTRSMYIIEYEGADIARGECQLGSAEWLNDREIDTADLGLYWLYVVITCVVLRVLSVVILMIINVDGFNWLKHKIKKGIKKLFRTCRRPNQIVDVKVGSEATNANANLQLDVVEMKLQGDSPGSKPTSEPPNPDSLLVSSSTIRTRDQMQQQAKNNELFVGKALYDYTGGKRQYELTFKKDTMLVVTYEGKLGWLWGHYQAEPALDGWFPQMWVESVEQ